MEILIMKQFEYMEHEDIMALWEQNKTKYDTFTQFLNYLGGLGWEIDKTLSPCRGRLDLFYNTYYAKREKIVPQQQSVNTGNHRVVAGPDLIKNN